MHKIATLLLFLSLNTVVMAQPPLSVQDSIAKARNQIHQNNMLVLGAWAGANIIQGSISASNTHGSEHYLHQMNAYWNTVNLAIAGLGLLQVKKQWAKKYDLAGNLQAQHQIEKILLLNSGLDLAYITTGLYLRERGNRLNNDRNRGYGSSLLLQGGFLLVFDLIQYAEHRKNGKWLEKQLSSLQIGPTSDGFGIRYGF